MRSKLLLLISMLVFNIGSAQDKSSNPTIQPKIMVIPEIKPNQTIEDVLNNSPLTRLSISSVKEAFNKRGFLPIEYTSKLRNAKIDDAIEMENRSDYKSEILESSGADIYVEVGTTIDRSNSGNNVNIILSAYDAFTSVSLANKSFVSPRFHTENFDLLVAKAMDTNIDDFMNLIQLGFDDMVSNGRLLAMNVTFAEDSEFNMDSEFEDYTLLSDLIENWLEDNAYNAYFHIQGVTSNKMMIDEIRVPLHDENGKNFRISKFIQNFRKYLGTIGITSSRDIRGGMIYISIL
jgi:hypothetical protein